MHNLYVIGHTHREKVIIVIFQHFSFSLDDGYFTIRIRYEQFIAFSNIKVMAIEAMVFYDFCFFLKI